MSTNGQDERNGEDRFNQVLLEYLEEVQNGAGPDREQLLARNPEFAEELSEFLECRAQLDRIVEPLQAAATSFLGRSELGTPRPADDKPSPGPGDPPLGRLGDYQLIKEIGRGGMGIVYEAEQISLRRRVALKILPFAAAFDPKQLQRFKNEALAAAHLNHPNIVPVYAVGSERGVHYYAMQFIDGQSLAALLTELRQPANEQGDDSLGAPADEGLTASLPSARREAHSRGTTALRASSSGSGSPSTNLNPPATGRSSELAVSGRGYYERVCRLGIKAAQALDHAHQLGVVHRDIKPANLLVDLRGNLWVADFGLALFQRDLGLTMSGELLGTLRYTSPELALGKRELMDHRTDIYSLGATLYELFILKPAFDGRDRHELMNQIAFHEPPPLRASKKTIPVELETIILKAMAKEPVERYSTALELADDLQRFLEHRPVLARRPTFAERLRKWSRRHRAIVAMGVLLMLLTLTGLTVSTVLIAREQSHTQAALERERDRTREAQDQRARAHAGFLQARRALDFITQIGDEELAGKPGMQRVRKKLLVATLDYYQSFVEQYREDPAMQPELARCHMRSSNILAEVHAEVDALAELERALEIQVRLVKESPSDRHSSTRLGFISYHIFALQGCPSMALMTQKDIQDDLKMTDRQVQQVQELADKLAEQRRGLIRNARAAPAEKQHATLGEVSTANEKTAIAILTEPQSERLRQLALQVQGFYAFTSPQVEETLRLAADQKEKIIGLQAEGYAALWEYFYPVQTQNVARRTPEEIRKATEASILLLLSPEQISKLKDLMGRPFQGESYFGNRRIAIPR